MTITIPTWLLWALGIPVGLFVVALLVLGVFALIFIWNWKPPQW